MTFFVEFELSDNLVDEADNIDDQVFFDCEGLGINRLTFVALDICFNDAEYKLI